MFLANDTYAERQLDVFNDILSMVADSVAVEARAEFADRIADRADAPAALVEKLARDDLAVASPILQRSRALTDEKLAEIAETSSQAHMLAISGRQVISEIITDVLVRRGDQRVVRRVAGNHGARFSSNGFGELVRKAESDQELQMRLVARQDLPAETVERLLPQLSEQLITKLAEAGYDRDGRLPAHILTKVRDKLGEAMRRRDRETVELDAKIAGLKAGSVKLPDLLRDLSAEDRIHDVAYVLAKISGLEASVIGSALFNPSHEPIMLVARALFLTWPTFGWITAMRRRRLGDEFKDQPDLAALYHALEPAAAQR